MRVEGNRIIYHDGTHNAFTSMVKWRNRYWVAFRNGAHHRSTNGRLLLTSSQELQTWSHPEAVIDSSLDDRDPAVFVLDGKIFVASLSIESQVDDTDPFGEKGMRITGSRSLLTSSKDGVTWSPPVQALPDHHTIWWVSSARDGLYASVQVREPMEGGSISSKRSELWHSADGVRWTKRSVISAERLASETALALLPDRRLVAFVRHDEDHKPEIKTSIPPYTEWTSALKFGFRHNGPCLGLVNGKLVTCSRGFFDDPATPMLDDLCKQRIRGMIVGTLDPSGRGWRPVLMMPHGRGVRGPADPVVDEDASLNWPDISYASIVDLGDDRFAMSYYEGFKGPPSDIHLAVLQA